MDTSQQPKSGVNPSLAELDNPTPPTPQPPVPNPPAPDPNKPAEIPNPAEEKKPEPGVEEGEEPEGEEPENSEETNDPAAFYQEVTKLRGDDFTFEFPKDLDPASPEGVHHAMTQLVEFELERFEQNLMKGDKRGYAYLLHRANGGSDEEFFATKTEVLPDWDVLKGSVDLQQSFYRRVLTRKEIAPEDIDIIVKNAVDKNKLASLVEVEYNRMKKADEDQAKEVLEINERNQKRQEQLIQKMGSTLQEKIIENKGLGITIPDAKRGGFLQFVNQLVNLDPQTGQWYIQQAITPENINTLLEALYYQSVGGNMEDIIVKRAKAENVRQLKLNMNKDKKKTPTVQNPNQSTKPGVQPALSTI